MKAESGMSTLLSLQDFREIVENGLTRLGIAVGSPEHAEFLQTCTHEWMHEQVKAEQGVKIACLGCGAILS